ncbi:MAG: TolC family protein [Elusimicrobiaceae bacterium]|nr:TolC family protein [Elusimicrobiaceae bacterium]
MKKYQLLFILGVLGAAASSAWAQPDDLFYSSGLVPPASEERKDGPVTPVTPDANGVLPQLQGELSLEDCIQIALSNSPRAVSAQLAVQDAQVNLNLARSEFLPTATMGASQGYANQKTDGFPRTDHGQPDVYAQAQLSLSGITDIARGVKISKLSLEQAQTDFEGVKNEISGTIKKYYYALLSAKRAVSIRTQSRDLYKDQYERSAEFFRLGLRPKVDVTTAEVNLNNEELSLIRARNLVKTASAQLANAMGVTASGILNIQDVDTFEKIDIPFDKAVETAYANRPDVLSARTGVKISQIQLNRAKAGFFPTFSFSAGFAKSGDDFRLDNEETKLMASVEFPIFNAFKTYNGYKQAQINHSKTLNSNRSLLNDVFLDVQNAYIKMQEAAESIPVAEVNVEKAKENLDLSRGRYNEGIGDIIELKDAEVAYTDAELSLLTARYDYASAVADLKQAMGTY